MSPSLSLPSPGRRSGLLTLVVGLHGAVLLGVLTAKAIEPQVAELPLIVDLLPAPQIAETPKAIPFHVSRPALPQPQPKTPAPILETTSAATSSETTPLVSAPAAPPSPPEAATPTSTPARFDADYLRNPPPPYPPLSRRAGEEGKVILRVSVTPQGTADNIEIRTSSGSARLDESAVKTVRHWKFIPAKRGDIAIQSWVQVPIIFKLEQ